MNGSTINWPTWALIALIMIGIFVILIKGAAC